MTEPTFDQLLETHTALVACGMPPLPNCVWDLTGPLGRRLQLVDSQHHQHMVIDNQLGADMLTQHATRWFMTHDWNEAPGTCSRIEFSDDHPHGHELKHPVWQAYMWYKPHKRYLHGYGTGPTQLAAIVAAATALEKLQ